MSTPQLLLAAGSYALFFWTVAACSSRWALALIFAVIPFQNDVSNGMGPLKFSLAEINLLLSLPMVLIKSRHLRLGPTFLPACLYLSVCAFSALGQWRSSTAQSIVQAAVFTVVLVAVFASLGRTAEDYRLAFNGLIVVAVFLAVSVFATGSSYVYGLNKNGVGASLASTFVIALEMWMSERRGKAKSFYLFTMTIIALGCLATVSRGAWLTAISGGFVILALRGQIGLALRCTVVMIPLLVIGWHFLPQESREYATGFGQERTNIQLRYESIDYAWKLFVNNPIQGAGMGLRKDYDATNILLLCLAETGVPGLLTFLGLNAAVIFMGLGTLRRVPPQTMASSVLVLAPALIAGKFMHGLVDHYWSRGSLTAAWATVGMAAFVIAETRRQRRLAAQERVRQEYERAAVPHPADDGVLFHPVEIR